MRYHETKKNDAFDAFAHCRVSLDWNRVVRIRWNPTLSVVETGIFRVFPEDGSERIRHDPILRFERIRSYLFRRNPVRNPVVRNPTITMSDPIGFCTEVIGFRRYPISDAILPGRIHRSD